MAYVNVYPSSSKCMHETREDAIREAAPDIVARVHHVDGTGVGSPRVLVVHIEGEGLTGEEYARWWGREKTASVGGRWGP